MEETKSVQRVIYTSSFFALGSTDGSVANESQVMMMCCHFLELCFVLFHLVGLILDFLLCEGS